MTGYVHVHGQDLANIWVLGGLFGVACLSALQLAWTGPRRLRPVCAAIAALSGFYSGAYVVLVVGPWPQSEWTRAIRYPAYLVIGLVWIYVPRKMVRYAREIGARAAIRKVQVAEGIAEKVMEKLGASDG